MSVQWIRPSLVRLAISLAGVSALDSWAASARLDVLNEATREVRSYEFGSRAFGVNLEFLKGWSRCEGRPLKTFVFYGVESARAELYCINDAGGVFEVSCVASRGAIPGALTITRVFSNGMHFNDMGGIEARGAAELSLYCSNP